MCVTQLIHVCHTTHSCVSHCTLQSPEPKHNEVVTIPTEQQPSGVCKINCYYVINKVPPMLQHVAPCCTVLHRVAACCSVMQQPSGVCKINCFVISKVPPLCSMVQRVEACCSVVQRGAAWRSVVQRGAACCSSQVGCQKSIVTMSSTRYLPCVACCSMLQCVALCCSSQGG